MVFSVTGNTILCFEKHGGQITDMIYVEMEGNKYVFSSSEDGKVRMFKYNFESEILEKENEKSLENGHFA